MYSSSSVFPYFVSLSFKSWPVRCRIDGAEGRRGWLVGLQSTKKEFPGGFSFILSLKPSLVHLQFVFFSLTTISRRSIARRFYLIVTG